MAVHRALILVRCVEISILGSRKLTLIQIVDFAVWLLFRKSLAVSNRPQHILCHGFQKSVALKETDQLKYEAPGIPGIVQQHPNENFEALKKSPWREIMLLLGDSGESIIQSLLLDCGIFVKLSSGLENFYQLSGIPISDLASSAKPVASLSGGMRPAANIATLHSPGEIMFVRSRMLYAKPSLNAQGNVRFGMKHIQVLNRYSNFHSTEDTVHVMKYVFPRQLGLHNVFTCEVDKKETTQPFKDYTLRENEIAEISRAAQHRTTKVPRRLRGGPFLLVRNLQKRHKICPYTQLLRHYCSATSLSA